MTSRTVFALLCVACLAILEGREAACRAGAGSRTRISLSRTVDVRSDTGRYRSRRRVRPILRSVREVDRRTDGALAVAAAAGSPGQARQRNHDNRKLNNARQDAWLRTAVIGPDQLRQRVAFALSEIMVVSQHGALYTMPFALAGYYDVLSRNAFGNFRQLMEEVTLHPAMGVYLSMLGNQKPDAERNIRPDENYARELLQLFTIGLVQLNPDGSVRTDTSGAADRDLRSVSR